jgi:long-chain acyl-CoA synthetase
MIQMLVDHPKRSEYKLDSITRIVYGSSPISEALLDRAMTALPGASFTQAYGMTETSAVVSMLGHKYHTAEGRKLGKLRSAGHTIPGCEARIVDTNRKEVARGVVGEIAARGPGIMTGYWNNEEQTKATVEDGWIYSGDGAYMDDDGFIFIVDRVKDMIVSGAENVYSAEVENALAQHPAIASCAVIGIPDERWGEAVHAIIVCKSGVAEPAAEEIKTHCREYIATYKCPRSVEYRTDLPLSGAGKIQKNILREPYWRDKKRQVN